MWRSILSWYPSYQRVATDPAQAETINGVVRSETTVSRPKWPYLCMVLLLTLTLLGLSQYVALSGIESVEKSSVEPADENTKAHSEVEDGEIDLYSIDSDDNSERTDSLEKETSGQNKNPVVADDEKPLPVDFDAIAREEEPMDESIDQDTESHEEMSQTHPPSLPSRRGSGNWFLFDGPGMDPIEPGKALTIWNFNISRELASTRTALEKRHPEMAFIKGLKVGGTTVAVALDHAARVNQIRLQRLVEIANIRQSKVTASCAPDASLWFHHGFRAEWMKKCMPNVRFLATIREPVGQALSWESMQINHDYYRNYPWKKCTKARYLPIQHKKYSSSTLRTYLKSIGNCIATDFRKNITLMLVANIVESWPESTNGSNGWPGPAVALSANWYIGKPNPRYAVMKSTDVVDALQQHFYLVAPVERMNQFLVLIAIHMGWRYESLYYVTCKPQDIDVRRADFVEYFPHLVEKLDKSAQPMAKAYQWAKENFDSHVKRLGPWFLDEVRKFNDGLKAYQKNHAHSFKYRWATYRYLDGHLEDC